MAPGTILSFYSPIRPSEEIKVVMELPKSFRPGQPRKDEIDVYTRYKMVYDRHQAGEIYPSIASDLGISVGRVTELAEQWEHILGNWEDCLTNPQQHLTGTEWEDRRFLNYLARLQRLVNAGLLGNVKRSPEYGYA